MTINRNKIFKASFWVLAGFGLGQLIRLGGNLILTRLLTPSMFGVVAVVLIIFHGINMFSDLGIWSAVVRNQSKEKAKETFYNTVWTIQIIRGWILFSIVFLGALSLIYFKEELNLNLYGVYSNEAFPYILLCISVISLLNGYRTLAPAILGRELQRGRLEIIELVAQILGMTVMLSWAYLNPSIWALASSVLVSASVNFILIYKVFDIRHKLEWDKDVARDVLNFGKWILIASALTYISNQGDRLFFSVNVSPAQIGVYSIAFMLVNVIDTVIKNLSQKVCYPVFCKKREQINQLKETYYKVRLLNGAVISLITIFLILIAPAMIEFLYDSRYQDAGWMLQILTVSLLGSSISNLSKVCLTSLGKTKVQMQVMIVRSFALVTMMPLFYSEYGFKGAIFAYAVNSYFAIPVQFYWLAKVKVFDVSKELIHFSVVITAIIMTYLGLKLL